MLSILGAISIRQADHKKTELVQQNMRGKSNRATLWLINIHRMLEPQWIVPICGYRV